MLYLRKRFFEDIFSGLELVLYAMMFSSFFLVTLYDLTEQPSLYAVVGVDFIFSLCAYLHYTDIKLHGDSHLYHSIQKRQKLVHFSFVPFTLICIAFRSTPILPVS